MNKRKLTARQERFVDEYLVDLNATQSAIRAGYSAKTAKQQGARLLTNADVKKGIAEAKQSRSEKTKIDAEYVLKGAVELFERCMQNVRPAKNPKTGKPLFDDAGNALYVFNAGGAARALEIIGKHIEVAAFKDRLEVSSGQSIIERLQQGRARIRKLNRDAVDAEQAPKALPKPKAAKPRPEPKPVKVQPKPETFEDAIREQRTRGLPDGYFRDTQGLIRNADGRVASGIQREREGRHGG